MNITVENLNLLYMFRTKMRLGVRLGNLGSFSGLKFVYFKPKACAQARISNFQALSSGSGSEINLRLVLQWPVDKIRNLEKKYFFVNCFFDSFGSRGRTSACGYLRDFLFVALMCTGG